MERARATKAGTVPPNGESMRGRDRKNHGQARERHEEPHGGRACRDAAGRATTPRLAIPGRVSAAARRAAGRSLPLDDTWCQWLVDNALRRAAPATMVAATTPAGIDPAQASGFLAGLPRNPMFRAAEKMRDRHERFARAMHHVQALRESAPDYSHVEKRSRVSRDEFFERYVRGCRPVVLTDLARDWPALQRWSFAEFKRRYGALTVQVQSGRNSDDNFEINKAQASPRDQFRGLRRPHPRRAARPTTSTSPPTTSCCAGPSSTGLLDEVGPLPDYLRPVRRSSTRPTCGSARPARSTPLHHDTVMLLHTQIVGPQALALRLAAVRPEPVQRLRRLQPGRLRGARPAALPRRRQGEGARRGGRARRDRLPAARVVAPGDVARPVHLAVVHQPGRAQATSSTSGTRSSVARFAPSGARRGAARTRQRSV